MHIGKVNAAVVISIAALVISAFVAVLHFMEFRDSASAKPEVLSIRSASGPSFQLVHHVPPSGDAERIKTHLLRPFRFELDIANNGDKNVNLVDVDTFVAGKPYCPNAEWEPLARSKGDVSIEPGASLQVVLSAPCFLVDKMEETKFRGREYVELVGSNRPAHARLYFSNGDIKAVELSNYGPMAELGVPALPAFAGQGVIAYEYDFSGP